MKSSVRVIPVLVLSVAFLLVLIFGYPRRHRLELPVIGSTTVRHAALYDVSPPLSSLQAVERDTEPIDCAPDCGTSPRDPDDPDGDDEDQPQETALAPPPIPAAAAAIEQKSQGTRASLAVLESFDGLGVGFDGPQGAATGRNPSDNSLATGPNHIVQIVNSRLAVFSKKGGKYDKSGKVLYGAVPTNTIFKGFGGPCEERNNGDAVVRYDQLADRWLIVMPIFSRIPGRPDEPYSMCYALSEGADPMGSYYRYEFRRRLFPDYPRPAVWTDGYYVPSSTGDTVIEKHACVVDRTIMLKGRDATEQCVIVEGVNFLNNADLDGQSLPPAGAPNIVMAAGASQLRKNFEDDGIYAWKFHVDWEDPDKTSFTGPVKIPVAPYHYLCDGQLTRCVSQPGTATHLDAQGDKLMQRLVYRNFGDHESLLAIHSINTSSGGGGVRWYEFRLNANREPALYQQGTYAPDAFFRWMGSPGMDRAGNIAIGYSFGGEPNFAGQRFAARLATDPHGQLGFAESIVAAGAASQTNTNRWEDYSTTAMDPSDDCTFWYVGDYYKANAATYSTRIASLRMPGCIQHSVSGLAYLDLNHNGLRDVGEPGVAGARISVSGGQKSDIVSGTNGAYSVSLPADPIYGSLDYTLAVAASKRPGWSTPPARAKVNLADPAGITNLDFAAVCTIPNRGGAEPSYWASAKGRAVLAAHDPAWRDLLNQSLHLELKDNDQFRKWLSTPGVAPQLAAAELNVAYGTQDGDAHVLDPEFHDWPSILTLLTRANSPAYLETLQKLNANKLPVTPSTAAACGGY